ncbi:polysaccharide biosynthesis tyrosine autokinase [Klenkia terrae]|uniref:Polysaccharide biosynthesis tyrosine autokinase n=1 Tax=Klenkia terrae TaxID=1052259 RepID=A0ABU8EC53_9ACTN|nr:polysaccharide biosynthesis tyrosine autokinase [Klenkia terrae]
MDLQDTVRVLRSAWWVLVVATLLGGAAAGGLVLASTPQYTADTRLFISTTGSGDDISAAVEGSVLAKARVSSYAAYLTDLQLSQAVVDDLDLDMTADELSQEITASVVPDTVILDVTVTDPSATQAQAIAESIGTQFDGLVAALETPAGQLSSPIQVSVIARPELPTQPSSPQPTRQVPIGLVLGFVLGCALVLIRHKTDSRVRTSAQAAELASGPGLAVIPLDDQLAAGTNVLQDREVPSAESFRQLRTSLDFVDVDSPPRTILVSSSLPGEGKTTVSVNLALALTAAGRRVVLVEADLRRPRVTRQLGLVSGAGLTSVLNGSADLDDVLQPVGDGSLQVLAAGPTPPNPGELLASGLMKKVLSDLVGRADIVLLDGPPLLPVSDAGGLAPSTDGVLLCVRYGQTRSRELESAARTLERVGARTLGSVFTFVPRRAASEEGLGYSYHYGEDPAPRRGWFARRLAPSAPAAAPARPAPTAPIATASDGTAVRRVQAAARATVTGSVAELDTPEPAAPPAPTEFPEPDAPAVPADRTGQEDSDTTTRDSRSDDESASADTTAAPAPARAPSNVPPRPAISGPDAPIYPARVVVGPRQPDSSQSSRSRGRGRRG